MISRVQLCLNACARLAERDAALWTRGYSLLAAAHWRGADQPPAEASTSYDAHAGASAVRCSLQLVAFPTRTATLSCKHLWRRLHASPHPRAPRRPPRSTGRAIDDDDSSSDDDSDDDDDLDTDDDLDSDDEEDATWQEYREVDADDDDDDDAIEPHINPARRTALAAADGVASLEAADGGSEADEAAKDAGAGRTRYGRVQYEQQLLQYAETIRGVREQMATKDFKRLTKKEQADFVSEQAEAHPPPGLEVPDMVDPGPEQLEKLLEGGRWCTTFVDVKMTTKQTPQGKKHTYSAMVMVGDLNGTGGYGIGQSKEASEAILKALRFAVLNSITIPRYRQRTVYYPTHSKYVRTKMSIFPRPLEFGLVASPVLVEACELLGLHDLTVKTHGSRNTRNVVKCFFQAISAIPTPQEVAQAKGCYVRELVGKRTRAPRF